MLREEAYCSERMHIAPRGSILLRKDAHEDLRASPEFSLIQNMAKSNKNYENLLETRNSSALRLPVTTDLYDSFQGLAEDKKQEYDKKACKAGRFRDSTDGYVLEEK